jgi:hypothetical protein
MWRFINLIRGWFGRKNELAVLRRAYREQSVSYLELLRLFTSARKRNEELRFNLDAYKAEADQYRRLTSELDARLNKLPAIQSEFRTFAERLNSI